MPDTNQVTQALTSVASTEVLSHPLLEPRAEARAAGVPWSPDGPGGPYNANVLPHRRA